MLMKYLTILTILVSLNSSATANTVLIDWSTATKVSNPAGDGKYWNSLGINNGGDVVTTALVDVTNTPSGFSVAVDITINDTNEGSGFGGNGINGPAGADPFDEAGAVTDGIFVNSNSVGTAVITLTGLASSTQYDFVAIGGRAANGGTGVIAVNQGTSSSDSYKLLNNGTLLSFSVTSTVGGVIQFDFSELLNDANGLTNATWNALSITSDTGPAATSKELTFADWISGFSGLGGSTGFNEDADGDGIQNGIEYYFGTHPGEPSQGLAIVNVSSNAFTFTHPLNNSPASDISVEYRWSKDETNFFSNGVSHQGTTASFSQGAPNEGMAIITGTITGSPIDQLFVDVKVSQN